MSATKQEIITFKADRELAKAIRRMPNRSAFIRHAVLAAIDNSCPVCQGTGILTPEQKRHWEAFSRSHHVAECDECHAVHVVCDRETDDPHS